MSVDPRIHSMLERLRNATLRNGARVIAFTAPHDNAGTTMIAGLFAKRLHQTGLRVLMIDASLPADPLAECGIWTPGDGSVGQMAVGQKDGPDQLWLLIHPMEAGKFNDPEKLKAMLEEDLSRYDAIIIDCAPVMIGAGSAMEAISLAAIADATILIGTANRTLSAERDEAFALLTECRATLAGIVINDLSAPTFGAELAREARRLERFVPRLSARFARWALLLPLFNVPA